MKTYTESERYSEYKLHIKTSSIGKSKTKFLDFSHKRNKFVYRIVKYTDIRLMNFCRNVNIKN